MHPYISFKQYKIIQVFGVLTSLRDKSFERINTPPQSQRADVSLILRKRPFDELSLSYLKCSTLWSQESVKNQLLRAKNITMPFNFTVS